MMMTKKIGKTEEPTGSLSELFEMQKEYQKMVTKEEVPKDSTYWCSYHIQGILEELGELLKADKRWKTHRNEHYDPTNKMEELADCFITLMNIAMFSGIDAECLYNSIFIKINQNIDKYKYNKRIEAEDNGYVVRP